MVRLIENPPLLGSSVILSFYQLAHKTGQILLSSQHYIDYEYLRSDRYCLFVSKISQMRCFSTCSCHDVLYRGNLHDRLELVIRHSCLTYSRTNNWSQLNRGVMDRRCVESAIQYLYSE